MYRNINIAIFTVLFSGFALAAGGEHHAGAVPVKTIIYQVINVSILFGGLVYFLRKPVVEYFSSRKTDYESAAHKAQLARSAAEKEKQDISYKITKLDTSADETIAKAQAEASDLRKSLIADAEAQAAKIRSEAQTTVKLELERAKAHLREDLIKQSLELARTGMQTKVGANEHQQLQSDFINSMQAVK